LKAGYIEKNAARDDRGDGRSVGSQRAEIAAIRGRRIAPVPSAVAIRYVAERIDMGAHVHSRHQKLTQDAGTGRVAL
jgi:hypothetical protein